MGQVSIREFAVALLCRTRCLRLEVPGRAPCRLANVSAGPSGSHIAGATNERNGAIRRASTNSLWSAGIAHYTAGWSRGAR